MLSLKRKADDALPVCAGCGGAPAPFVQRVGFKVLSWCSACGKVLVVAALPRRRRRLTLPRLNGAEAWGLHRTHTAARPCPPAPTLTPPGSPERVAVLAARWAAGFALWHPADVRIVVPTYVKERGELGRFVRVALHRLGVSERRGF